MDEPMINMLRVQLQKIYNVKIGDYDKAAELRKIETRIWQEFNDKKGHCHHAMDQIRIDMKHTSLFLIKFNKAEVKPLLVAEIEPENKSYAYYY